MSAVTVNVPTAVHIEEVLRKNMHSHYVVRVSPAVDADIDPTHPDWIVIHKDTYSGTEYGIVIVQRVAKDFGFIWEEVKGED